MLRLLLEVGQSPCTCAKFNEIPETDRPTDTHNRLEMRCKISCLALRRSAIILDSTCAHCGLIIAQARVRRYIRTCVIAVDLVFVTTLRVLHVCA